LSQSLLPFQRAMETTRPISQKVTAFTASDFQPHLPEQRQASDHGWGSHTLIVAAR